MANVRFFLPVLVGLVVTLTGYVCSNEENAGNKIVCYFTQTRYFLAQLVPPDLCTHIIYAFGKIQKTEIVPTNPSDKKIYAILTKLKVINPQLKVMLSLQDGFPTIVGSSPDVVQAFSKNAVSFLRNNSFDGVDFDWEFPKPDQKNSYMKFLETFRQWVIKESEKKGRPQMLVSMALSNSIGHAKTGYDIESLKQYIDFATIMSYDFHVFRKNVDNSTGYNSALYKPKGESQYYCTAGLIQFYLQHGLPASKTLVGLPTFGRSYTLANPSSHGLHAPAVSKGDPSPVRGLRGVYTYTDSCYALKTGATRVWDGQADVPYMFSHKTWVSYDDLESIEEKVNWAKSTNLGGVGVWALHLDDTTTTCTGQSLPLMRKIKETMD